MATIGRNLANWAEDAQVRIYFTIKFQQFHKKLICSPMGHRGFLHAHDRRTDHRRHRGLLHEQEAEPPYKPNDRAATEVVTPNVMYEETTELDLKYRNYVPRSFHPH